MRFQWNLSFDPHIRLLSLVTDEEMDLYPAFQIDDGRIVDGLQEVLRVLSMGTVSRWTWAQWLNAELPQANPHRCIDALKAGRLDEVLLEARHDAWWWSS